MDERTTNQRWLNSVGDTSSTASAAVHKPAAESVANGFCCIGLDNPKTAVNVGAVLRAAGCFDARMVAVAGRRYQHSAADARRAYRDLPFLQVADLRTVIPYDCVPVAVELIDQALPLTEYLHPERAFYIFGAEDATLGQRITSWCRDTVYIPTAAPLNLAATVNIVLYDRLTKRLRAKP